MKTVKAARARIQQFADTHKLVFADHGEVGFGRPCVGLTIDDGYVDYNPWRYVFRVGDINPDLAPVEALQDQRLGPPESVSDAYHKHACLAVLVHDDNYDAAILQLADWIASLEQIGVDVVEYPTGALGIHALVKGTTGYALRATVRPD